LPSIAAVALQLPAACASLAAAVAAGGGVGGAGGAAVALQAQDLAAGGAPAEVLKNLGIKMPKGPGGKKRRPDGAVDEPKEARVKTIHGTTKDLVDKISTDIGVLGKWIQNIGKVPGLESISASLKACKAKLDEHHDTLSDSLLAKTANARETDRIHAACAGERPELLRIVDLAKINLGRAMKEMTVGKERK